jgi:hypothetical protein
MPDDDKSGRKRHGRVAKTRRPDPAEPEAGAPLPEEVTGRASGTSDDLTALFKSDTAQHFADGFRGGSNSDPGSDLVKEVDTDPDAGDDVTAI